MPEPKSIRAKTRQQLNDQLSRVLDSMNEAIANAPTRAERDRIRSRWSRATEIYWRYANNMDNSKMMRNFIQQYGEQNGGNLEGLNMKAPYVAVPRSQYMKNNRR